MTLRTLLLRALDRLTLYLPLLVMALLAMGSWWLVRSMPDVWGEAAARPVRKEPDYHLERFTSEVFDAQGQRLRQLWGDKGRHYPDSDELHIEAVRYWGVNGSGAQLHVTARQGIATGDGERLTLLGQAHAVRPAHAQSPRLELRGERLVALQKEEKLLSSDPVEILRGGDRFTGETMDLDARTGQYELRGRVRGLLQPRP